MKALRHGVYAVDHPGAALTPWMEQGGSLAEVAHHLRASWNTPDVRHGGEPGFFHLSLQFLQFCLGLSLLLQVLADFSPQVECFFLKTPVTVASCWGQGLKTYVLGFHGQVFLQRCLDELKEKRGVMKSGH